MRADLHIHTVASDGVWTSESLVAAAIAAGLDVIAVTDHDTIGAVAPTTAAAHSGLRVIPGIEFSSKVGDDEVHILGLAIDPQNEQLCALAEETRQERRRRAERILARLQHCGIPLAYEELACFAGMAAPGRLHIARAMVAAGYVVDIEEAFLRFLNPGGQAYEARRLPEPAEVITCIHAAGGLGFMAHPGLAPQAAVETMLNMQLDGLEAYHSRHTEEQAAKFADICRSRSLLVTGGSDCHGLMLNRPLLLGSVTVSGDELAALLAALG